MTTEFAVLNPMDGNHVFVESEDAAVALYVKHVLAIAMPYFNGVPYMKVIKENGTERWVPPDGNVEKDPAKLIEEAARHAWALRPEEVQT